MLRFADIVERCKAIEQHHTSRPEDDAIRRMAAMWIYRGVSGCVWEVVEDRIPFGPKQSDFFETDNWLSQQFAAVCGWDLDQLQEDVGQRLDALHRIMEGTTKGQDIAAAAA